MKKYIGLLMAWLLLFGSLSLSACTNEEATPSEATSLIEPTTTMSTTTSTAIDRTKLGLFDPLRYENADMAKCMDYATFEYGGLCMEHRVSLDDRVADDWYVAFIWIGEAGVTMPDYLLPEDSEEWSTRRDCLQGGHGTDIETRTILFCEGVPNLGDYFLYNLPECPAVYIPDSVTSIGEHTFAEDAITVIHCHAGSYAEQYAEAHGMKCEIVKE